MKTNSRSRKPIASQIKHNKNTYINASSQNGQNTSFRLYADTPPEKGIQSSGEQSLAIGTSRPCPREEEGPFSRGALYIQEER
jgi:hypothetical protein